MRWMFVVALCLAPASTAGCGRQDSPPLPAAAKVVCDEEAAAVARIRPAASLPPAECPVPKPDALQRITGTPASPYYVHHPGSAQGDAPVVVFLPGGSGSQTSAQRVWQRMLRDEPRVGQYLAVVPYAEDVDFIDDAGRTFAVLDEVLTCFGGDPARVHLAGYSLGGLAAFQLVLSEAGLRFVTLLGTPGYFANGTPAEWAAAAACASVFNGVGELDEGWREDVEATHQALSAAGVDSVYVEYPGQEHKIPDDFDESVFFDFWESRAP